MVKRIKRPITVWEKTFADDISDKVLVSRRYKELSELNKQSSLKVDKRLEQTPPQKGHTDGKPAHKNVQYPPPGDVCVTVTVGAAVHLLEQLSISSATALNADGTPE